MIRLQHQAVEGGVGGRREVVRFQREFPGVVRFDGVCGHGGGGRDGEGEGEEG